MYVAYPCLYILLGVIYQKTLPRTGRLHHLELVFAELCLRAKVSAYRGPPYRGFSIHAIRGAL
jgi:hypothetical protein